MRREVGSMATRANSMVVCVNFASDSKSFGGVFDVGSLKARRDELQIETSDPVIIATSKIRSGLGTQITPTSKSMVFAITVAVAVHQPVKRSCGWQLAPLPASTCPKILE